MPVVVKVKLCWLPDGSVTLSTIMCPFCVFTNVHVTVSPADTTIAFIGLLSEQVALVWVQPVTAPSETEYVPGVTSESLLLDNVPSASSSKSKLAGFPLPKLLVKVKSCASSGTASLTIMTWPRLVFVRVQVIDSPPESAIETPFVMFVITEVL